MTVIRYIRKAHFPYPALSRSVRRVFTLGSLTTKQCNKISGVPKFSGIIAKYKTDKLVQSRAQTIGLENYSSNRESKSVTGL